MTLKEITLLLKQDMAQMNIRMKSELKSKVTMLNILTQYTLRKTGKQIRPKLVYLTAGMCGTANDSTTVAATMIEILHTATLIHDDVVDDSDTRRGIGSINAIWKNKMAVLLGDYMMSKGLLIALESNELGLLEEMSNAVKAMSEGELLQMEKAKRLNITEENYYDIISRKTASLIQTSCKVGCMSVCKDEFLISQAEQLGYNLGMAFQIKDDLMDLGSDDIGKPLAIDIKEKKMTLPLIYTLQTTSTLERLRLKTILRLNSQDKKAIKSVIESIKSHGGIDYAIGKMNEYIALAKENLTHFPSNQYKEAMDAMIHYLVERKK